MKIHESKFLIMSYFSEQSLIDYKWLPATEDMTEEEYKEEVTVYIEAMEKYKPSRSFLDNTEMDFPIVPHLQEWLAAEIYPRAKRNGGGKLAILVSSDLVTQLGTEQAVDVNPDPDITVMRFFDKKETAMKWLDLPSGKTKEQSV